MQVRRSGSSEDGGKESIKHPAGTDFVTEGGAAVWGSRDRRIKSKRERMTKYGLFFSFKCSVKGCQYDFPSETMHVEHQEACMQAKRTTCWFTGSAVVDLNRSNREGNEKE